MTLQRDATRLTVLVAVTSSIGVGGLYWYAVTGGGLPDESRGPLAVVCMLVVVVIVVGQALALRRSSEQLATVQQEVLELGSGARLRVAHSASMELAQLTETCNQLLERRDVGVEQARRFSSDAAHELKTPITILLGHLRQALTETSEGSSEELRLQTLVDETERLRGLIEGLLLFARLDAGIALPDEAVDFSAVARETCEDLEVLAESQEVSYSVEDGLTVAGSASLLRQVVANLMSNAIKYNRPNGTIAVTCKADCKQVVLTVSNTGKPIPETDQPHVFNRFFRADESRCRTTDGHGLGLSLAHEITTKHGGALTLGACDEDLTTFRLELPAAGNEG